jgi:glutaredoxin
VRVEIYSKSGCCLCDQAKAVLERAQARVPFELVEIDIARDPRLLQTYGEEIPVVFVDGRKAFKYHVDEADLMRRLSR